MNFFGLPFWGLAEVFERRGLCHSSYFGSFQSLFLPSLHSFSSLYGSPVIDFLGLWGSKIFFSLLPKLDNFVLVYLQVYLLTSLSLLFCSWAYLVSIWFWLLFLSSKILVSLFIFYLSVKTFIHFRSVSLYLLEHFHYSSLKSLSLNFNISLLALLVICYHASRGFPGSFYAK